HQPAADTLVRDALQSGPTHEIARFVQLDDPALTGLERIRLPVELVAVQRHPGFEPECVARAKAHGQHVRRPARGHERAPEILPASVSRTSWALPALATTRERWSARR